MAIELNNPGALYKEFYGNISQQMPKLLAQGRTPMSFKDVMQRRLEVANSNYPDLIEAWLGKYFDTGDACVIDSNGNLKVVLDSKHLRELNSKTKLTNGAIVLSNVDYSKLGGEEFSPVILNRYTMSSELTEKQVNNHPVWVSLARGDEALLKAYSQMIFAKAKEKFNYDKNMGIYLLSSPEMPQLRSWYANSLYYRSIAFGRDDLGCGSGRLVGVAPEAKSVKKNLESKIMR